ncbi:hypothetical protein AXX17_AT5G24180 [Arabidopsis thaliana]|uniref:Uncharacterized protein n=1 Tax=Arabidopsis thaliana TaxID=3702 RepID=A0A178UH16_ARATH|nr:hypothetical protein AXX17_AT5G24180 [Arabidopsis thaliana]
MSFRISFSLASRLFLFVLSPSLRIHIYILNQILIGQFTYTQTIAIIPLGSSGLVQLGSTQKILESTEILEQTTRALQETC